MLSYTLRLVMRTSIAFSTFLPQKFATFVIVLQWRTCHQVTRPPTALGACDTTQASLYHRLHESGTRFRRPSRRCSHCLVFKRQPVVKVVLWSRGAHLTKPGWSKPHTHSNPTNLALFRHKITLYRFNQGSHTIAGGLKWEQGAEPPPPEPPHFNHWRQLKIVLFARCYNC